MDENIQQVADALKASGLAGAVTELAVDVPTAATAAAALGCDVGAIANSLIFAVDGDPLLILTSGAHRVDTRKVARLLGVSRSRIKRAAPEFVLAATGQAVGGVAPVGHPAPVRTIVDEWLDRYPQVWAAAGRPHAVFPTTFAELLEVTGGEAADIGED
jgi:prolyl-tRNA editing enzyme YbaK/EbsC (Cys-tRNA(Pro) deacylase)